MKNMILRSSVTRVVLALGLGTATLAGVVRAEPGENTEHRLKENRAEGKTDGQRPGMAFERMKQFLAELDLSTEQKAKLEPILKEARAEGLKLMKEGKEMQPRDRIMKLADLLAGTREKIKAELTPEQNVKFEAKLKETRNRIAERVGENGMGGRLKEALASIDLTPEQKEKADAILEEAKNKVIDARTNAFTKSKEATDDAREKTREILKETREKLAKVLTPDQMDELREHIQASDGQHPHKTVDASVEPKQTR